MECFNTTGHRERKFCIIMNDFNLDLLKLETHPNIEKFLNTLGSLFSTAYTASNQNN